MVWVDQLDLHLVLAGRQPGDVDRVVTRIRPPPGQVVDGDVQMPYGIGPSRGRSLVAGGVALGFSLGL